MATTKVPTYSIVVVGAEAQDTIQYTTGFEVTVARGDVTLLAEAQLLAYQSAEGLGSIEAVLADMGITDNRREVF